MSVNQERSPLQHKEELQIMEFTINDNLFGLDVAQVREIMIPEAVKPMPYAPSVVEGVFKPREKVITVVNLPRYLELCTAEDATSGLFIITEFDEMTAAFRVQSVVGIEQVSRANIQNADQGIFGGREGVVTGIASCGQRLITILDFKKILKDIAPILDNTEIVL